MSHLFETSRVANFEPPQLVEPRECETPAAAMRPGSGRALGLGGEGTPDGIEAKTHAKRESVQYCSVFSARNY